jgi:hypothetical protein
MAPVDVQYRAAARLPRKQSELLTWSRLHNRNANPAPGQISEVQLLTGTRFAALRSYKYFGCKKLVEAGGVEPPSEKRNGPKPTCLAQFARFRLPRSE